MSCLEDDPPYSLPSTPYSAPGVPSKKSYSIHRREDDYSYGAPPLKKVIDVIDFDDDFGRSSDDYEVDLWKQMPHKLGWKE